MREEYATLEANIALIDSLSDLLRLHTIVNTRLRIVVKITGCTGAFIFR